MSDLCEQGVKIQLDYQKQIAEDRLAHQKAIDLLVTKVTVQTEKVSTLINATEKEIKACKESRGFIHKRINKIWMVGTGALLTAVGWLVTNYYKGH